MDGIAAKLEEECIEYEFDECLAGSWRAIEKAENAENARSWVNGDT